MIATPEGVEIELEPAGVGSRAAARLLDYILQVLCLFALGLVYGFTAAAFGFEDGTAGSVPETVFFVIYVIALSAIVLGYDIVFETFNAGQTPGKKRNGLRVVTDMGGRIGFKAATIRNLLRIVDEAITLYLGAFVSITRSAKSQRLGDMAAGTMVVREADAGGDYEPQIRASTAVMINEAADWDIGAIESDQINAINAFLGRRRVLSAEQRRDLAERIAVGLRPRIVGAPANIEPERLLEVVAALHARRA